MKWITAADITTWANTRQRECAGLLPELVRRLIFATANSIEEIEFPIGDSTANPGWDGHLKTSTISPFFPSGVSGWEIGTDRSASTKAEGDYAKRTKKPLGIVKADSTFVFVTPRSWPGRNTWRNSKCASGNWKDVRVVAADALEQWISSVPAVGIWLARRIGKVVSDEIRDLESFWEEWSLATHPQMTSDLVVAGRFEDLERVKKWLTSGPGILEVQGDSPDEAFAFLFAAVHSLPENDRSSALARCVVVDSIGAIRACVQAFQYPLIIAATSDCMAAAGAAVTRGHHVYLSVDSKVVEYGRVLRLSRPHRDVIESTLVENGVKRVDAATAARDFGRSLPVLRRHFSRTSSVVTPQWMDTQYARFLLSVLLAGAWDDRKEGDRKALEDLSGLSYKELSENLYKLLTEVDSPIQRIGETWILKSPVDAWFVLARTLDKHMLELFRSILLHTITSVHPKYDLAPEKRWSAAVYGKSSSNSDLIRNGLTQSLVFVSVFGDKCNQVEDAPGFAAMVVAETLGAGKSSDFWASLKDVTPLLAEAAPEAFLTTIETTMTKNPEQLTELLKDSGDALFGECQHSGILWALEAVAWSPDHFARTAKILTDLALIDPGGRWANRPINSLRDLFLPRYPQTYATPEERLLAFDNISSNQPVIAWKIANNFFGRGFFSESSKFRWRDSGGNRGGLEPESIESHNEFVKGMYPMLADLACRKENLFEALENFTRLPSDIRTALLKVLTSIDPGEFGKVEREKLLKKIRKTLHWITNYGKAEFKTSIKPLDQILDRFTPTDALERAAWLLGDPWPQMPHEEPRDHEAQTKAVAKARIDAAREVLDQIDLGKIIEFGTTCNYQGVVGDALARAVLNDEEDNKIVDAIIPVCENNPLLLIGYAGGRIGSANITWIKRQVERLQTAGTYTPIACALIYLGLPEGGQNWQEVEALGGDVKSEYWKRATGRSGTNNTKDITIAVKNLLEAKRPGAALEIAGAPNVSISSTLLKQLIQELIQADPDSGGLRNSGMLAFHLAHVFDQLYDRNELTLQEIALLEWPFAALFDDLKGQTTAPLAMHRLLQVDPAIFWQLVTFAYKSDSAILKQIEKQEDDQAQTLYRNAKEVLSSWRLLPGLRTDGSIDEEIFSQWIENARSKCAESGHVTGGDLQIAELLSHAPRDNVDGLWPHVAVRNVIESLSSRLIERHIEVGVFNNRGVTSRNHGEGGRQERELSTQYRKMSETMKAKWPRTAAMLRSLSESYENDAKREDTEAELDDVKSR